MSVNSVEDAGVSGAAVTTRVSQPRQSSEWARSQLWLVGPLALVLALAYAMPFGSLNQATYLLDPLHRALPELFARDWLVSETPPYMPGFGWLAQWLFVIDGEGTIAVVAVHVVVALASYAAIHALVRALHGDARAWLLVACFVTVTKGMSMGRSYLFAGYLQPSELATLGWLVALAAFVRDRYLTAGIAAALAGALHANFLVLGIGLFLLAAVARRDLTLRDFAKLLAPQLVVLACCVPQLADAAGPSERAIWILSELHAPGHYSPRRLLGAIPTVVCWQLAAYGAMYVLCDVKAARVLWRFSLVASAIACTSALLVQLDALRFLVQVYAARVAPFAQLACLVLAASALVRQASAPRPLARLPRVLFAVGLVVPLLRGHWFLRLLLSGQAIAVACAALLVCALAPPRVARAALTGFAALAFAFALVTAPPGRGLTTRSYGDPDELALTSWARSHTETDALFLIPPRLDRFRLHARRAVVVDTKSPPLRPDLLEQWYARLCAAVRAEPGLSSREIEQRYDTLGATDLLEVARAFGADYIVTGANVTFPEPPRFRNAEYAVYRVQPPS